MAHVARILGLAALLLLWGAGAKAADIRLYEREIKAGLLYNFLKYTNWPEEKLADNAPISVCLFGGDPFGGSLDKTGSRTVQQRAIKIRKVGDVADTSSCNLVYVNEDAESRWPELSKFLRGKSVLTVSDFEGFTNRGGMIEFTRAGSRVNVLINIGAVTAARLSVQDRMLKLTTVVRPDSGGAP